MDEGAEIGVLGEDDETVLGKTGDGEESEHGWV